ncbi:hypothetical protein KUL72_31120 [Bradyrhizobium arachidis]|uniref:hypothetical protein n=1 Tax=Bradyrhizobium arachidis TaxID=858423 RepID=UPI002163F7E7|nr:hypothetical protein [Bradyrhizobium arachidis]UVO40723.1 hypothetical protein KUL72_31120 [Bradyrhizobium arachidis]
MKPTMRKPFHLTVGAVILKLLDDLRREDGMAFLFVSQDLNVARMMCNWTIVLQQGRILEEGDSQSLFRAPRGTYTQELLEEIPHFEPQRIATASCGEIAPLVAQECARLDTSSKQ